MRLLYPVYCYGWAYTIDSNWLRLLEMRSAAGHHRLLQLGVHNVVIALVQAKMCAERIGSATTAYTLYSAAILKTCQRVCGQQGFPRGRIAFPLVSLYSLTT